MRGLDFVLCLTTVAMSSVGQVLLRHASRSAVHDGRGGAAAYLNGLTLLAACVYLGALLLWFFVLGRVPLTRAFGYFGLSFFLVPFLAHRFLGDPVSWHTWVGAAIIVVGIYVIHRGAK